ncbi:P22 phage major capsid protein family protein [Sneathiella aquimaris]|uniref:P22 phage major capsid protein family protein n=1 Tax=Sneathiella aquimaris TaxID=2599305 RepID=UPI00146CF947|nr:P22 phage major capsid protein family protein [Sneathiella aquimaris]
MSNDVSAVMPKILARGLMSLREQAIMPRLVNGNYSAYAAEKGDTIDVPIPADLTAENVTPGSTQPAPTSVALQKVQIELNNWKKANFHLTDKEMMEVDGRESFLPMQASSAIRALANAVNQSIHSEYKGVYGTVGVPGATPFASTSKDATNARKLLLKQRAPKENRYGVLNFDAEANALDLAAFADADKAGDTSAKLEGEIGRKYGINWYSDDHVARHETGASGTPLVVASGSGGNQLVLDGLITKPAIGDVFTVDGDEQQYVVRSATDLSVDESTLTISPALNPGYSDGTAVTFLASHEVNLVFNRDAFAFANRPLAQSSAENGLGNQIMSMTDPETGLSLRLEVSRQYKQVVWEFDILWGVKLVRPELAVRLAG